MRKIIDNYNKDEFEAKLNLFLRELPVGRHAANQPKAFLLGGQSGAGKTKLHNLMNEKLDQNAIVINGDEYRSAHPNFTAIQERFGIDAPAHTAKWAGQMTEALINALSSEGYNLIIEGTLRTSDVPLKTAALLKQRGYSVSLAVMAVKPEVSLISCQLRYEMMRLAGTVPRATDPEHHNKIVHDIVNNITVLEQSDAFDSISLYNRSATCLYPVEGATSASDVLQNVLFGNWTAEERDHYRYLQEKLKQLTEMG